MTFKLFLLWSFVLLGRPQDLLPFLQPIRPALLLTAVTTCGVLFSGYGQKLSATLSLPETKRYLLFFFIMLVGIPFAYHRRVAFDTSILGYLPNVLFYLILVSLIDSLKKLKSLVWIICVSTFVYSFFGYVYGDSTSGRFWIYGSMFDPNDVAYVLISTLPLCLFYLYYPEGAFKKLLCVITICSSIAVILLTGSRGGITGLVTVFTVMLFKKKGGIKTSHKVLLLAIAVGAYFVLGSRINVERYRTLTDIESDYNITDEFGRTQIWTHGIAMALEHPITGVGAGCFNFALGNRRERLGLLPKWQAPHNSFVQVAAETGLVGFVVFLSITRRSLVAFFRTRKIRPDTDEGHQIMTLGGLMYLAFVGHLVTGFFLTQGYSIFFTLFFAFGAVIRRLQLDLTDSNEVSGKAQNGSKGRSIDLITKG